MDKTSWRDTKTTLTIQTYRKAVAIHGLDFTIARISQRDRRTNRTAGSARTQPHPQLLQRRYLGNVFVESIAPLTREDTVTFEPLTDILS